MMETSSHPRGSRGIGGLVINGTSRRMRGSKNKSWTPGNNGGADSDRWERGGHRGGGRGRAIQRHSDAPAFAFQEEQQSYDDATYEEDNETFDIEEADQGDADVVDYQNLVKAREAERKKAIAEGKMDDPLVPKRLDQAITMVGTCTDMCPRFERYRRERENNLTEWELIPGTKRVDHSKAIKMYERAAGDKTLPSDLRPPHVLKRTLDYLFHDLLVKSGFNLTFTFIRDRSRAVRSDFTIQHETGPIAIECHDRCARYHILALHFQRDQPGFSIAMEEQLLMNTLQSLKEFYEDQRGKYESPTELEMRVYHRLIHIRDQKERHDDIPSHILENPVFKLITRFRQHVQVKSAPITKTSVLVVAEEGMAIFGELAAVLRQESNTVMIYLVACILERLFGKGAVQDDLEAIRGDLSIPDIIDGKLTSQPDEFSVGTQDDDISIESPISVELANESSSSAPPPSAFVSGPVSSPFGYGNASQSTQPIQANNAFSNLVASPSPFGTSSPFGGSSVFGQNLKSVFGGTPTTSAQGSSPFSNITPSPFGANSSPFGGSSASPFGGSKSPFDSATFSQHQSPGPSDSSTMDAQSNISAPATSLQKNPLFTYQSKPLNPTAPPFLPYTQSELPFQPGPQPPITPAAQPLSRASTSSFFSTPPLLPPTSTVSLPTSTREQPAEPSTILVTRKQTLWELPSTPSERRPPRIDTDVLGQRGTAYSPKVPPPIPRVQPVPLPPSAPNTPEDQSFPKVGNNTLRWFPSVQTLSSSPAMLSPLILTSPTTSRFPLPAQPESPLKKDQSAPSALKVNGSGALTDKKAFSKAEAKDKVSKFSARSVVVRECFAKWRKRSSDKVEYSEAVKRSDEYSRRVQQNRMLSASASSSVSGSDRKRRISGITPELIQKKRVRKRASRQYLAPRTDEDLVRRLTENHEEHELRWAQGTFLQIVRSHVTQPGLVSSQWQTWLSMNPDNDGTAIWLERKFDVPSSGRWISENVFSMGSSLESSDSASLSSSVESPGLIMFECTPLEGLEDELEKKYRILDDCSRLRDVILSLPPNRHYMPSLLLIVWTEEPFAQAGSDLRDMIDGLIQEKILRNYSSFTISSSGKDLDERFTDVIASMQIDTSGEMVQLMTGNALLRLFTTHWSEAVAEWVENCSIDDKIDWMSYGDCLQATVNSLDVIARHTLTLLGGPSSSFFSLPSLQTASIQDSSSAYNVVISWLDRSEWNATSTDVLENIRSHKKSDLEFPVSTFWQDLPSVAAALLERLSGRKLSSTYSILKDALAIASQELESEHQRENDKLIELRTVRNSRMAVKRRPSADSQSQNKRPRTSLANGVSPTPAPSLSINAEERLPSPPSPSPSVTSTSGESSKPVVTVEMLRELTRSVMKNYGSR